MSNYGINLVDSGYDDDFWVRYEEERKKLKEQRKAEREKEDDLKSLLLFFLPDVTMKRVIIITVWIILYKFFIDFGYGIV
jgi:hypothetical protein